ncbi:quinone-dependent dihydroorotate dehydrogenase [Halocynthiibacter namhaensis]|uniref:quinone-dependent dihydroorotate dehydrogenase n=1 Tax=Halocynthiibacter namhaensis TaxID=1290553 RepID=UPI00057983B3|nr:quinone-dependent dihydroorotate dehydrogenase [Halocynthiibacter namhaensis]
MKFVERAGLMMMRQIDPERAHGLAIKALKSGIAPLPGRLPDMPRLKCEFAGLKLSNPLGLAAGFDKNAEVIAPLLNVGFGFIEVGAATPRPQEGNPKPRLFRLPYDQGVINRFGFNNQGMSVIGARLADRQVHVETGRRKGIVGLNLGANKDSDDRAGDFARVLAHCGADIDFATVNVSSPNTEKLRDLQGAEALSALLNGVLETRDTLSKRIPIFLKIAPDLSDAEIADIVAVAFDTGVDAIIATNTTLDRDGLHGRHKSQAGGLSGVPLFEKSTRVLARIAHETGGAIPLMGVGGVSSAEDAFAKIQAGASAVQLYSGLVYNGLSLVKDIRCGLDQILGYNGFSNISEAVGSDIEKWL